MGKPVTQPTREGRVCTGRVVVLQVLKFFKSDSLLLGEGVQPYCRPYCRQLLSLVLFMLYTLIQTKAIFSGTSVIHAYIIIVVVFPHFYRQDGPRLSEMVMINLT